ncbi:large ribosomal subunit protein mL62 [Euwallacea fornicatus]|uniref:large ribosomal subunit protein mL62 n=1 Tax=Euwallacea fornicatus TaxID=995702 RepID=UPI00338EA57B
MISLKSLTPILSTIKSLPNAECLLRSLAYKSAISLDKLYPNSSLKLITPAKPSVAQSPDFDGYIPMDQIEISYSCSSGPGGQNVNKVNTKVDVRFHVQSAKWLSDKVKAKVLEKFQSKINKEGHLVFRSDITRSQQLNLADCLEKLRGCIRESLYERAEPSEETQERIRKRIEKANRERLAKKRHHGALKAEKRLTDNVQF